MRLEQKVAQRFIEAKKTLSIAESCTGGLVSHLLTNVSGASTFFWLGIIAYDNKAKVKILKVPPVLIKKQGAVSAPVALAMAKGVRALLNTDYALSITGIAGPTGATAHKPVGLIFIALQTPQKTLIQKFQFKGSRLSIKKQASQKALTLLSNCLD